MQFDDKMIRHIEIESVEDIHHKINMVDIEVLNDNSFTLSNGLISHNSAAKTILSARSPKIIGVYPLKGKPLNVRDIKISRLTNNEEFANIMSIIGLKLGHDITKDELRFGRVLICADFDPDGSHICGLIVNMFQQFWPELLMSGLVYRLRTPLIVAVIGKTTYEFFSRLEYENWKKIDQNHKMTYYKGLGSWSTKDFTKFMNDPSYHEPLVYTDAEDFDSIDLAFDRKRADDRKDWLSIA